MKGRLLTNGILSIIGLILFIILIIIVIDVKKIQYNDGYQGVLKAVNTGVSYTVILVSMIFVNIAAFIMGIITLSMKKSPDASGLTITSGILGIFSGLLGIGAIVSFIGFAKAKN